MYSTHSQGSREPLPLGSQLPAAGRGSPAGTFHHIYMCVCVKEKQYNKDRCYIYTYIVYIYIIIYTAHILMWYDNMYGSYIYIHVCMDVSESMV